MVEEGGIRGCHGGWSGAAVIVIFIIILVMVAISLTEVVLSFVDVFILCFSFYRMMYVIILFNAVPRILKREKESYLNHLK